MTSIDNPICNRCQRPARFGLTCIAASTGVFTCGLHVVWCIEQLETKAKGMKLEHPDIIVHRVNADNV